MPLAGVRINADATSGPGATTPCDRDLLTCQPRAGSFAAIVRRVPAVADLLNSARIDGLGRPPEQRRALLERLTEKARRMVPANDLDEVITNLSDSLFRK
jgi:hypothetical protein